MSNEGFSEEQLQQFNERANIKDLIKGGQSDGRNGLAQEILAQDKYKQNIVDGLLQIERKRVPMKDDEGRLVLQEFVKLEDGSGKYVQTRHLDEEQLAELKSDGVVNEKGAKDVLTTLNGISNNNVSLSNLTQKQINDIGRPAVIAIHSKLKNNREEYSISSTDDIEWIMTDIVVPNVLAGLSKAKNGAMIGELLRETRLVGSLDDEEDDSSGGLLNYG